MRRPHVSTIALMFAEVAIAAKWLEPVQTPMGIMATAGFSPLPTQAPGLRGLPAELLKRQDNLPATPPEYWCGFIDGDPDDPLECEDASSTCVFFSSAIGCCGAGPISLCTNLFTSCANYVDTCDDACIEDYNILKCSDVASPYCGTYAFTGGTANYDCGPTSVFNSVEFIADLYASEGLAPPQEGPVTITATDYILSSGAATSEPTSEPSLSGGTAISNVPVQTSSPTNSSGAITSTKKKGISSGAIAGIAVGIVIVILAIVAGFVIFWLRKRRQQRRAAAGPGNQGPGMNQVVPTNPATPSGPMNPNAAQGAYNPQSPTPTYSTAGQAGQGANPNLMGYQEGAAPQYYDSKPPLPQEPVRCSSHPTVSEVDGQDAYKGPTSPSVTEVDGRSSIAVPNQTPDAISPVSANSGGRQQSYGFGQGQQAPPMSPMRSELSSTGSFSRPETTQHSYSQLAGSPPEGIYEVSGTNTGPVNHAYELPNERH